MGLRGPKPVNRERLEFRALQFANFLYTLRDGYGQFIKSRGPRGSIEIPSFSGSSRETLEFIQRLQKLSGIPFEVVPCINSRPAAWEQLKRAQTEEEIRRAARSIRHWAQQVERSDWRTEFPGVISDHAKNLLCAKKGWNYPRKRRPKSDDKRVLFFAKVLAGFMFGLSPGYATKKLAYWDWSKEWIQGPFVAMEKRFGGSIVDFSRKEKMR